MTSSATMPYPCSFASIRGKVALLEKNKKVKISKQSEPNIGKLPGSPSDLSLNRKPIFAIRTQEVIQNNTDRSLGYPGNPRNRRYCRRRVARVLLPEGKENSPPATVVIICAAVTHVVRTNIMANRPARHWHILC
jgi:hypothetical protein